MVDIFSRCVFGITFIFESVQSAPTLEHAGQLAYLKRQLLAFNFTILGWNFDQILQRKSFTLKSYGGISALWIPSQFQVILVSKFHFWLTTLFSHKARNLVVPDSTTWLWIYLVWWPDWVVSLWGLEFLLELFIRLELLFLLPSLLGFQQFVLSLLLLLLFLKFFLFQNLPGGALMLRAINCKKNILVDIVSVL